MENTNVVTDEVVGTTISASETLDTIHEQVSSGEETYVNEPGMLDINTILSDGEYEKFVDSIKNFNIIEASRAVVELKEQVKELESSKALAESIKSSNLSGINRSIAEANVPSMNEADSVFKNIDQFLESYDSIHTKIEGLVKTAEERFAEFDNVQKTTTYMTSAMMALIDSKIKIAEARNIPKNAPVFIYYRTLKDIFTHRTSVEYILNRIPHLVPQLNRLKRDLKNKTKSSSVRADKERYIATVFGTAFSKEQIKVFIEYILKLYDNSDAAYFAVYALASIYELASNFKKTGEHKWVEVLVMNVIDISTDMYDMEGGKDTYDAELLKIKSALGY